MLSHSFYVFRVILLPVPELVSTVFFIDYLWIFLRVIVVPLQENLTLLYNDVWVVLLTLTFSIVIVYNCFYTSLTLRVSNGNPYIKTSR